MSTALKIAKLPDLTPIKLTVSLDPALQSELETYAQIYERAYGDKVSISALIPSMLNTFLASDSGFKKARKLLAENNQSTNR